MGRILKTLGPIIVVIISVVFTYYINLNEPDVRFTLSEQIPVTFADPSAATPESVQQLEIKNIGNAEAERIVIKIDAEITAFTINKYSESDSVQVFDTKQPIEFVYTQLPPQANFTVVFKSLGNGIDLSDVSISHDAGLAREALTATNSGFAVYILYGFILLYVILSLTSLRSILVDTWKSGSSLKSLLQVIQNKRPWYFFENEWQQSQINAIRNIFGKSNWLNKITKLSSYQFLKIERPKHIEESNWNELNETASDILEKEYSYRVNSAYSISEILDLLRAEKPYNFPEARWSELKSKAEKQYLSLKKKEYYNKDSVIKAIKEARPLELSQDTWNEYVEYLENTYLDTIIREIEYRADTVGSIENFESDILSGERKTEFENKVGRVKNALLKDMKVSTLLKLIECLIDKKPLEDKMPNNIEEWQWIRIKRFEKEFHETSQMESRHEKLTKLLRDLLYHIDLGPEKPVEIDESQWETLKDFETQLKHLEQLDSLREENEAKSRELAKEKNALSSVKSKVLIQLDLIDKVVKDPSQIDRIEDYDDTFSPGNFENIRKIASLLKKNKGN